MYFTLKPFEVTSKVLDTSFLAGNYPYIPPSLGLRTQALKLRFATSGVKANFLSADVPFGDVVPRIDQLSQYTDGDVFHKAFIGETISKIYSPVYINNNTIYDGILRRPIIERSQLEAEAFHNINSERKWNIKFNSALCPTCGWDLTGDKNSVVLFCKHCDSPWEHVNGKFKALNYGVIPCRNNDSAYIAFWRLKINIDGLPLSSYEDLIKFANLPKAVKQEWADRGIYFWTPAFTIRPKMFMRLSKQLTISQPSEDLNETLPRSGLNAVTLNVHEAFESVKVMLAHLTTAKNKIFPLIPEVKMDLQDSLLVYLPFTVKGNEFIQTEMNFSIQRNALRGL